MKIGIYIKQKSYIQDARLQALLDKLTASNIYIYNIEERRDVQQDTDIILSVGGDGTFLSASKRVADSGIPLLGINFGRMGFLSENTPEDTFEAIMRGQYIIEDRDMLYASVLGKDTKQEIGFWPYALNEVTVHRKGASVMGIKIKLDEEILPTYWADGLIISTSSGSTAYSLSAGGPICTPESKVLLIVPIAPHNLNIRPLVVPDTTKLSMSVIIREDSAVMTMDNRTLEIDSRCQIDVSLAGFSLKRIRLNNSNYVNALTSKLFWGEDIRNNEI